MGKLRARLRLRREADEFASEPGHAAPGTLSETSYSSVLVSPKIRGKARQSLIEAARAGQDLDENQARRVRVVEYEVPDRDGDGKGKVIALVTTITEMTAARAPLLAQRGAISPSRQAPKANAICERMIGTLRREVLDRLLILDERHLRQVPTEYLQHYNTARPHRTLHQLPPAQADTPPPQIDLARHQIRRKQVLGGLTSE
jgi:Integrase core domain